MKWFLIGIIKLYKALPLNSHMYCKFYPTCSSYAIDALKKYGSLKGTFLSIKRILRCNPKSKGGYDPVP